MKENAPAPEITPEILQQNPLVAVAMLAFVLLFGLMASGAIASWVLIGFRFAKGQPILPTEPWKPRVWGFFDLIFSVGAIFFWQVVALRVGVQVLGIDRKELGGEGNLPLTLVTFVGIGNVLSMLTIIVWIMVRHRASASQVGFGMTRWAKHLGIGVVAAVAVLPFVYVLMAVVSFGMKKEYNHPLLDAMKSEGSLQAYLLAVLSAAIIAPLVEEFLFRVLIQGWLQSWRIGSLRSILLGASEERREQELAEMSSPQLNQSFPVDGEPLPSPSIYADPNPGSHVSSSHAASSTDAGSPTSPNPYSPIPTVVPIDSPASEQRTLEQQQPPPLWPAFVTGTFFGLAHLGYGLSFIPLIFLGIMLGLLYRATHSIWPSLAVHFILNSTSMIALGVGVLIESVTKK